MITDVEIVRRRELTFEQAEGAEPLPTQMQLGQISKLLRANLWAVVYETLKESSSYPSMGGHRHFDEPWSHILYALHVTRDAKMADDFENDFDGRIRDLRAIFEKGDYIAIFGWLQAAIRQRRTPASFVSLIGNVLQKMGAPYRIFDGTVIAPIITDDEKRSLEHAFATLHAAPFAGARRHLQNAASELTTGHFSDSVRESIHAVESVARVIEPSAELSKALAKLEASGTIHGSLKKGFLALYGYSSDEQGIRHPLLDGPEANVSESEALFMIGACASFVSFLIGKARTAGL